MTEFSVIPGIIQIGWWFKPVEYFREKGNTFRSVTFFSRLPEFPETAVLFVWTYQCQALHGNTSKKECQRYEIFGKTFNVGGRLRI